MASDFGGNVLTQTAFLKAHSTEMTLKVMIDGKLEHAFGHFNEPERFNFIDCATNTSL